MSARNAFQTDPKTSHLFPMFGVVLSCLIGISVADYRAAFSEEPEPAVSIRLSAADSPIYPLLPVDITIRVQNTSSKPMYVPAFFCEDSNPKALEVYYNCIWRFWSSDGTERRLTDTGAPKKNIVVKEPRRSPLTVPGESENIRQVVRLLNYEDLNPRRPDLPKLDRSFPFPRPGICATEVECAYFHVRSNKLQIAVREPEGRDREAYDYLLKCKWPFFVTGLDLYRPGTSEQAADFLSKFPDTVYSPYARFYLSIRESWGATDSLSSRGVVENESFLQLWDVLLPDRDFRLRPWVQDAKARYLEALARPRYSGYDAVRNRRIPETVVRLGKPLTAQDQEALGREAKALQVLREKEYPYFPD